jgi:LmbE family N-acetylglucosaminyl deacetylase
MVFLVIVAHPDDEILGFGGSCYTLSKAGHEVYSLILCGGVLKRKLRPTDEELYSDVRAACNIVGYKDVVLEAFPNLALNNLPESDIVECVESYIKKISPNYVYTHHMNDLNIDHRIISKAVLAACRIFQRLNDNSPLLGVYYIYILSSTDWSFASHADSFQENHFIEIGSDGLEKKLMALNEYRKVMRTYPHPRSHESVKSLSILAGSKSGLNYAESFEVALNIFAK